MRIRRATPAQALETREIDGRLWALSEAVGPPGATRAYWVVDGNPRRGYAVAAARGPRLVFERLWVPKALRGRGLGQRLTRARLAWGRTLGCTYAQTYTWNGNVPSARNLIRAGFMPIRREWDGQSGWLIWRREL